MNEYVVLDFETANADRGSACQIGLVRANERGQIINEFASLIRPDCGTDYFDSRNVAIHGIRASDVVNAPTFAELADELLDYIGAAPVVAHNMPFDYSVWKKQVEYGTVEHWPGHRICTVKMARSILKRPNNNKLNILAAELCPTFSFSHHNALEDCYAANEVFTAMRSVSGMSISEVVQAIGIAGVSSR